MAHSSIEFIMMRFHDMILNPLFLHLINSMTAHQNCLVGMHDTSYDTPYYQPSKEGVQII